MVAGNQTGAPGRSVESRIELLEREGRFPELATELSTLVAHAHGAERARLLARLGEVRLRLDDVARALSAFRESLEADPTQPVSRRWLEVMLAEPEHAVEAGEILGPIYAAECRTSEHAAAMLLSILEKRAERTTDEDERVAIWAELGAYFDQVTLPADQVKEVSARMLKRVALGWPGGVPKWIERVMRVDDVAFRVEALLAASNQSIPEPGTAEELAVAAGEALEAAGRLDEAFDCLERALALDPSSPEVVARLDALASRRGEGVESRVARFRAAIDCATEPERRAALRYALGVLIETAQSDLETAMDLWKQALSEVPSLVRAHESLVAAYTQLGNDAAVERELERALGHFTGLERRTALLRLGEVLAARGEVKRAIARVKELIADAVYEDPALYVLERFGEEANDDDLLRAVYERRVDVAPDRAARARALEGLAEFENERLGDKAGAAEALRAAAELMLLLEDRAEAERLYERALAIAPGDHVAAQRFVELCVSKEDFGRLADAMDALRVALDGPTHAVEALLALEPRTSPGQVPAFAEAIDRLLAALDDADIANARALLGAKARVLGRFGYIDEAAAIYENLIEAFCEEEDVRAYVGLVESSPVAEYRHAKRRWLLEWRATRAEDPVPVLVHWAAVEEQEFNDIPAAIALLLRAIDYDGSRPIVYRELARLRLAEGDAEGALEALAKLRALDGEDARGVDLTMADLLVHALDRPGDALAVLAPLIAASPTDAEARALSLELVESSPVWLDASDLLERAARGDAPAAERSVLAALLAATERRLEGEPAPELVERRRRWYERVLGLEDGEAALGLVERAALEFPADEGIWEAVERLAVRVGDAPAAARAYERAIRRTEDAALAELLGKRLLAFADQHIDNPRAVSAALEAVLERVPGAGWAFERVKFALGAEQRWAALFPLYDRFIAALDDDGARAALLDEAAIAARDVAGDPERAIGYWEQYFALRPNDVRVDVALERLYERQRKLRELIAHLEKRAAAAAGDDVGRLRERIAALWVELGDPRSALAVLEALPDSAEPSAQVLGLLERVVALAAPEDPAAASDDADVARRASKLLTQHYANAGRTADVARVVRRELRATIERDERIPLLRQLADLERTLGNEQAELDARGELLLLEPGSDEQRERLGELARALGAESRLVELLVLAAERADDRVRAARLLFDAADQVVRLADHERAIEIYGRVLNECGRPEDVLEGARRLEQLLLVTGRAAERCAVLERLAELEPESERQKQAWLEAARVALQDLADPARAARAYRVLLEREPTERELHDGLVRALLAARSSRELVEALERRAALDPKSREARRDLGEVARVLAAELGEPARAIETWRSIRATFGHDQESFEALAALLESQGEWHALAALLAEEAESARVKGPLYQRLAAVHRAHTGDLAAALDAYIRADDVLAAGELVYNHEELLSDDPSLTLELAAKLERANRISQAVRLLRRQLEHYGPRRPNESVRVHLRVAELLRRAGKPGEALAELSAAAERHPSSAEIQAALADAAAANGDLARAEQSYRALLLLPGRAATSLGRAEIYLRLSDIAARRGSPSAAEDHIASAFEAALGSDEEAFGLERALRERGRKDLLERAIASRLERTREPSKVLGAVADLLDASAVFGEVDPEIAERALRLADRAVKDLESSDAPARAFSPVVEIYDKLGRGDRAIAALELSALRAGTAEERDGYALEVARRLLALPARREDGLARLWDLVRRDARDEAACELLLREIGPGPALDDFVAVLEQQIAAADKLGDADRVEALSVRRATALERAGRLEDALQVYERLATHEPYRARALREIVRLLEALSAPEGQVADALERLLEVESGAAAAEGAVHLAELRRDQGDRQGLERALERAFVADPSHVEVRDELVRLLTESGRHERLAELLEGAVQVAPADGVLRLTLAQAYRACGAFPQALSTLDAALAQRAPEGAVRRERAAVLEAMNRHDEALAELDAAHALLGGLEDALFEAIERTEGWKRSEQWALRAADLAAEGDRRGRARRMLELWVERRPDSAAVLSRLGHLAALDRDFPVAIDAFRRLARLESGAAQAAAVLALVRACEAAGKPEEALAEAERAFAEGADTPELRRELGKLYAQSGDRAKQARLLVDEARSAEPSTRAERLLEAVELFVAEAAWEDAESALEAFVALDPERVEGIWFRAKILAARRGAAEARRFLEGALSTVKRRDKRHARLFRLLGDLHLADDELAEALAPLSQAYQLDKSDGETALLLGLLAYDLDRIELAAVSLRGFLATKESASAGPQLSRAYAVLACIEHARGQRAVARRMASRALEVDASNEQARRLLGALA